MKRTDKFQAALDFATLKHKGQYRIGGLPYITHPCAVAAMLKAKGYDEEYQIAGLFHDLLEDTDATEQEIEVLGGEQVLETVKLLTKQDGYVMAEYVAAIKNHPMAAVVKAMDRLHNLQSAVVTDKDFKQRYIQESRRWYLDFSPEILKAVETLEESLL